MKSIQNILSETTSDNLEDVKIALLDIADDLKKHQKMTYVNTKLTNSLSTLIMSKAVFDYEDMQYFKRYSNYTDIDIKPSGSKLVIEIMYNNDDIIK